MYDTVIVVPYRNRPTQLEHFINIIAPKIQKYIPNMNVIIVEQYGNKLFNRGKLINVGCLEYKNKSQTFIIHDIDLEPDDSIIEKYYAPEINIEKEHVRGLYNNEIKTLGGIYKIEHNTYFNVNGHHNKIWGWGLEDQDFKNRMDFYGYNITFTTIRRSKKNTSYFKSIFDINEKNEPKSYSRMKNKFFYNTFKNLSKEIKEAFILKNGVNNTTYKLTDRTRYNDYIEKISVII